METRTLSLLLLASALSTACLAGCSGSSPPQGNPPGDAGHERPPADTGSADGRTSDSGGDGGSGVVTVDPLSTVAGSLGEHEPFIAVSPKGRVAVSFLASVSSGYTVGYRISNDGGKTWGPATLFPIPAGDNVQANASVAASDDDTLYMAWGAEERTITGRANQHVFAASSAPGTTAFGAAVEVSDPKVAVSVYDQPRVTVTHGGVVNVGYMQGSPDMNTFWLDVARSTDGKTWMHGTIAGPGSFGSFRNEARFCRPEGSGRIFVAYVDSDLAEYVEDLAVALRYSDDDGATWSAPARITTDTDELTLDSSANLGCATSGKDVWVYYGLTQATPGASAQGSPYTEPAMSAVRLAHSGDSGMTVDSHADVMDKRAGALAMYPVLAVEEGGALDLSYYAGSYVDDPHAELRRTRSTDGRTFPPTVLVHHPLTLETSRTAAAWVGDFVGGAERGGNLFLVFTDNAGATPHVAFARTPTALPKNADEPDASAPPPDGGADAGCYSGAKFVPNAWAPPTSFGQGACTSAQISSYMSCSASGSCAPFRASSANAACLACLETPVSASAHGPFITQTVDGGVASVDVNYGGCQAHFDGKSGAGSCGNQVQDFNDCYTFECQGCSDFSNPSSGGPTYQCYFTAIDVGACTGYRETTACYDETTDGGSASACNDPSVFVPLWCGP